MIDVQVGDNIYIFMSADYLEQSSIRLFLLRYVRIKRILELYPEDKLKIIWFKQDSNPEDVLRCID